MHYASFFVLFDFLHFVDLDIYISIDLAHY